MGPLAGWVLLGLIAGALARWILPGEERGGWFGTLILGIIGAILGGWLIRHLGIFAIAAPGEWFPAPASIVSATLGSILVLAAWKWLKI
ncbi:GlsB/YeaQ/YmgE family stress response membrane protein [Haloferula sp.]|uniref:GlsB/YeaQ/YmgE family stress response membrane protein n=1 Tax=Haloferula sp. TaxID=2497595 RepID=UPI003C77C29A